MNYMHVNKNKHYKRMLMAEVKKTKSTNKCFIMTDNKSNSQRWHKIESRKFRVAGMIQRRASRIHGKVVRQGVVNRNIRTLLLHCHFFGWQREWCHNLSVVSTVAMVICLGTWRNQNDKWLYIFTYSGAARVMARWNVPLRSFHERCYT